jgi:hypothetical protein
MTTRAERKQARRDLAAWLRARGLAPTGEVWRLADTDGVRDIATLTAAAAAANAWVKITPAGERMPMGLRDGIRVPGGGRVIGTPVTDPDTGEIWVTVGTPGAPAGARDIALDPNRTVKDQTERFAPAPAPARPARTAPAWVQAAAAEYRGARDAWEAEFERVTHTSYRPGLIQAERRKETRGGRREVTDYLESHPAPRYRDHLSAAAARMRDHA